MIKEKIKSGKDRLLKSSNNYSRWYKITDYILFFFSFHLLLLDGHGKYALS